MDLNYILHRHQVSLVRSGAAACPSARMAHRGLARGYARRIRTFQRDQGARVCLVGAA